jgi:hypothetical protein
MSRLLLKIIMSSEAELAKAPSPLRSGALHSLAMSYPDGALVSN